jgi:hypothetical protein
MNEKSSSGPMLYASVSVAGDIDHEVVSAAMGARPSQTGRRGEVTRPYAPPIKETYWLWRMESTTSFDGTSSLRAIVDRLEPRIAAIDELRKAYGAAIVVRLNAYVTPPESIPTVYLGHQLLTRMAKLNIDLEFDFMLLAPG